MHDEIQVLRTTHYKANHDLNSALVDGQVTEGPTISFGPDRTTLCWFVIEVRGHWVDKHAKAHDETAYLHIETRGRLAQQCRPSQATGEGLRIGQRVRVVGRLAQETEENTLVYPATERPVYIAAEVVEIKPEREQGPAGTGAETITIEPA